MKRWMIVSLAILLSFGMIVPAASTASAETPTVRAAYNENTGFVTVTGALGTASGTNVSVKVMDPENRLDYLDQGTTGLNGAYTFSYKLKQRIAGLYTVTVGGERTDQTAGTTFTLAPFTIDAGYDVNTGSFNVSGSLGVIAGTAVTIQIQNPNGSVIYSKQGATGASGAYQFVCPVNTTLSGTYTLTAKGPAGNSSVSTTVALSFNQDEPGTSSPSTDAGDTAGTAAGTSTAPSAPAGSSAGTPSANEPANQVAVNAQLDPATGIARASIDLSMVSKIKDEASVTFEVQKAAGAKQYAVNAPVSLFTAAPGSKFTISTAFAAITMNGSALSNVKLDSVQQVELIVAQVDADKLSADVRNRVADRPAVDVYMRLDGKPVIFNNPGTQVTVSIPYKPTAEEMKNSEHLVILYVDSGGNVETVPSGKYDEVHSQVTFTTSHFSMYAVGYVMKTFADLQAVTWAKQAIEVMASKGIINGTSETTFNPGANITRADFLMLLTKTLNLKTVVSSNFSDVYPSDYYYEAVGTAKQLGLADGQGDNRFNPKESISRQDMIVLLARAMRMSGKWSTAGQETDLLGFKDKPQVAAYAVNDIAAMVNAGIIEGNGGLLNPKGSATRAEAAMILYRVYNK